MGLPRSLTLYRTKSCRFVFHGFEIYVQDFNISFDIYFFISIIFLLIRFFQLLRQHGILLTHILNSVLFLSYCTLS